MKFLYTNPEGNRVVVGFAPQVELSRFHPELSAMTGGEFQSWAISRIDPEGTLSITILADEDPIPLTPEETFQALVKQFDDAVEAHLHAEAVAQGYSNIERACMYASYYNPYQDESRAYVKWVGEVWAYCYQELQKVQEGTRTVPTIEQIISELPVRNPIEIP